MIPSFLIFLREGIEGTMILSIMCSFLASLGRRDMFRWVFLGAGTAAVAASIVGAVLYVVAKDSFIESTAQTWFETAVFVVAVLTLTYMTFWMRRHARSLGNDLGNRMEVAVAGGSALSLTTLAFVTVGREALETAIFLLAIAIKTPGLSLLGGAVFGLAAAMAASFAIYRLGARIRLRQFFTVLGAALMIGAAGLLADAVQNLQGLGVIPGEGQSVWNTSKFLDDGSGLGDVLHGVFGYASSPSLLQIIVWAAFLLVGLAAFLGLAGNVLGRLKALAGKHSGLSRA
jgi:high-affinity iron transporter